MQAVNDDYDTPWKDAVTRYFPEFMSFYFPRAHAAIDWARPYAFLEQELAQVVHDAELGKRLVDKLVQVFSLGGMDTWVLLHIDVQGTVDSRFAERMFVYNYRIYDRFRRPVASMALLADGRATWLYDRDWDRQRIIDLFNVIDWMMRIPKELQAKLMSDIADLERNYRMPYVSSFERLGRTEGLKEGRRDGMREVLDELLNTRFGTLSPLIRERISNASEAELRCWSKAVLNAPTLDDVFAVRR